MKKSLIALALAGALSAPAFASTGNVDVYGTLDVSVNAVDQDVAGSDKSRSVTSSASRIGFKGTEALGNGMNAVWQIESGLSLDETGHGLTSRNSFVGLQTSLGTVLMGTHDTPMKALGRSVDTFADTMADSRNVLGAGSNGESLFDLRAKNAVAYFSPDFSGFRVAAAYSTDMVDVGAVDNNDTDALSLSGTYADGPLTVGAAYETHDGAAKADMWRLVAGYDVAGAKLGALYERADGDAAAVDRDAYGLFGSYAMGPWNLKASYLVAGESDAAGMDDGAEQWAVGVDYSLSKRTVVYGYYAAVDNGADAAFGLGAGAEASDATTGNLGTSPTSLGLGMRHSF